MKIGYQNAAALEEPTLKDSGTVALPLAQKSSYRGAAQGPEFEQLLDSEEAAALLKIHPKTLQKMARNHEITGVHIGKLWRFRASALNEWLEQKIAS